MFIKIWLMSQHQKGPVRLASGDISLKCEDEFCYLDDTISARGGTEARTVARIRNRWRKCYGAAVSASVKRLSLHVKCRLYVACVRTVMLNGSEFWAAEVRT